MRRKEDRRGHHHRPDREAGLLDAQRAVAHLGLRLEMWRKVEDLEGRCLEMKELEQE